MREHQLCDHKKKKEEERRKEAIQSLLTSKESKRDFLLKRFSSFLVPGSERKVSNQKRAKERENQKRGKRVARERKESGKREEESKEQTRRRQLSVWMKCLVVSSFPWFVHFLFNFFFFSLLILSSASFFNFFPSLCPFFSHYFLSSSRHVVLQEIFLKG